MNRNWEDYEDNEPALPVLLDPSVDDDRHFDTMVYRDRHLIERRNGPRVWLPHKCINCGASIRHTVAWTRRYYWEGGSNLTLPGEPGWRVEGSRVNYKGVGFPDQVVDLDEYRHENLYDVRFHEACTKCKRRKSWEYLGPKPAGWRQPPMPAYKSERDTQREALYRWQRMTVAKLPECSSKELLPAIASDKWYANEWATTVANVDYLFDLYGMARCTVVRAKPTSKQCWMRGRSLMSLAEGWGQTNLIIIHEFAHAVACALREKGLVRERYQDHGPEYLATLILLLQEVLGIDIVPAYVALDSHDLRCADLAATRRLLNCLKSTEPLGPAAPGEEDVENERPD